MIQFGVWVKKNKSGQQRHFVKIKKNKSILPKISMGVLLFYSHHPQTELKVNPGREHKQRGFWATHAKKKWFFAFLNPGNSCLCNLESGKLLLVQSWIREILTYGIRNPGKFCLWNPESWMRNTTQGIRNPTNDWNSTDLKSGIQNIRLSWIPLLFGQVIWAGIKTLSNTNVIASRHIRGEKNALPVNVRRSKTLLLKLPNSSKLTASLFFCSFRSRVVLLLSKHSLIIQLDRVPSLILFNFLVMNFFLS